MAKLQKTLEAVKAFDQNAIYVTEEAHEAMGSNFTYKPSIHFKFVLFCFVLFCFVLFCFVLFCFVLFCFVLFCLVR